MLKAWGTGRAPRAPCRAGLSCLGVVGVHSVVAHLRVGQRHDLPRVGGVGDDFQIALQRGVEADLPKRLAGRAAGGAGEPPRCPPARAAPARPPVSTWPPASSPQSCSKHPSFPRLAHFRLTCSRLLAVPASPHSRESTVRPSAAPAKKALPPWTGGAYQAHKMKFAHRTLPVSRYRPLKVVFEHKAPC